MTVIKYFGLKNSAVDKRSALVSILHQVKDKYPDNVVDLQSYYESDNFDLLVKFLIPEYMPELLELHTDGNEAIAFKQATPEFQISTLRDLFKMLLTDTDLQLVKLVIPDGPIVNAIKPEYVSVSDFFKTVGVENNGDGTIKNVGENDFEIISKSEAYARELTDPDLTDIPVPISDHDRFINAYKLANNTNSLPPLNRRISHYVISDRNSWSAANMFNRLFDKQFGIRRKQIPVGIWVELLQSMVLVYRNTILKLSPSARPLVYAVDVKNVLNSVMMIADDQFIVEDWHYDQYVKVNSQQLIKKINKLASTSNSKSTDTIPIGENLAGDANYTSVRIPINQVDMSNVKNDDDIQNVDTNNVVDKLEFDAALADSPILDNNGNQLFPLD